MGFTQHFYNYSLLKYGGDIAVGAMTILSSVMQFAMLPLQGLGQGAQPVISYNYGAKNEDRVRRTFFCLFLSSMIYAVLLWGLVEIFPSLFVSMFTSDETLRTFTVPALRVYMAAAVLFGIQIACQITFTALGDAASSMIVAITRKFILLIPFMFIFPLVFSGDQTMAVFMAEPAADAIAVTFTAVLFSFRFRKALRGIAS